MLALSRHGLHGLPINVQLQLQPWKVVLGMRSPYLHKALAQVLVLV
jgi:hypothetical protein